MKRYTKGFTLIELLVVIAIIGILASVVLVSLQSARKKGTDTRVVSSVQQLRVAMEADFNGSSYANSFTPAGATYTFKASAPYNTLVNDIAANGFSGAVYGAHSGILTADTNGLIVVTNGVVAGGVWTTLPTAYAIRGKLPSTNSAPTSANSFCIDSTGNTKALEADPAIAYPITCIP